MMTTACRCRFCTDFKVEFWKVPEQELIDLATTTDDRHKLARVRAFIELLYRAGVFAPSIPYVVWRYVMGPGIPPSVSANGFGAFARPVNGWAH